RGPDLDGSAARPRLRHRQGLVQVRDLDLRIATDQLLPLNEEAVPDDRPPGLEAHRRRRLGTPQLVPMTHLCLVLGEPPPDPLIPFAKLLGRQRVVCRLVLRRAAEQKHVLHAFTSCISDKRRPPRFDRLTRGPVRWSTQHHCPCAYWRGR